MLVESFDVLAVMSDGQTRSNDIFPSSSRSRLQTPAPLPLLLKANHIFDKMQGIPFLDKMRGISYLDKMRGFLFLFSQHQFNLSPILS
jgi:hypothetical protein